MDITNCFRVRKCWNEMRDALSTCHRLFIFYFVWPLKQLQYNSPDISHFPDGTSVECRKARRDEDARNIKERRTAIQRPIEYIHSLFAFRFFEEKKDENPQTWCHRGQMPTCFSFLSHFLSSLSSLLSQLANGFSLHNSNILPSSRTAPNMSYRFAVRSPDVVTLFSRQKRIGVNSALHCLMM